MAFGLPRLALEEEEYDIDPVTGEPIPRRGGFVPPLVIPPVAPLSYAPYALPEVVLPEYELPAEPEYPATPRLGGHPVEMEEFPEADPYAMPGMERFRGQEIQPLPPLETYRGPDFTKIPVVGQVARLLGAPAAEEVMPRRRDEPLVGKLPALGRRSVGQQVAAQELFPWTAPGTPSERVVGGALFEGLSMLPIPGGGRAAVKAAEVAAPAVRRAAQEAGEAIGRALPEVPPAVRRLATEEAGELRPGEFFERRLSQLDGELERLGREAERATSNAEQDAIFTRMGDQQDMVDRLLSGEGVKVDELQATAEALEQSLKDNPGGKFSNLVSKSGRFKGEIPETLTKQQYRALVGKAVSAASINKQGRVPWHIALDEAADEAHLSTDAMKGAIQRALTDRRAFDKTLERLRELDDLARLMTPAEAPPAGLLTPDELRAAADGGVPIPPGPEGAAQVREALGKERGFARTVRTSPETTEVLQADLTGRPIRYPPITNQETLAEAQEMIAADRVGARARVFGEGEPDATTNTVALLLLREADQAGNYGEALDILELMSERGTKAGQFNQVFALWNGTSPESILRYAQRVVKQAQAEFPQVKMTPEQAQEFAQRGGVIRDLPDGREKTLQMQELLRDIWSLVPVSLGKKVAFAQTLAQLVNPKTWIRNIFGNLFFLGAENLSRLIAVGLDMPLSLFTGERSVVAPSLGRQWAGLSRGARESAEEVSRGVNLKPLPTQYDLGDMLKQGRPQVPMFRGIPVLDQAEKLLGYGLRVPDRAFYEAAWEDAMWNQAHVLAKNEGLAGQAYGQRVADLLARPTEKMLRAGHVEGLYRTFQDDNVAAAAFQGLKKSLNQLSSPVFRTSDFGLGDLTIKYPRTPPTLLVRGLEYTPGGFFKALLEVGAVTAGKQLDQKALVETLGRATVGTAGLTLLGMAVARLGLLTGRGTTDKDVRALEREQGLGPFRFNVTGFNRYLFSGFDSTAARMKPGDRWMSYEWALPLSIPVAIGAEMGKPAPRTLRQIARPKPEMASFWDDLVRVTGAVTEVTAVGIDTLAVQPMMSGLRRLFGGKSIAESWGQALMSLPASMTPSVLSMLNAVVDNAQRETYSPDAWREALNYALAKVPGLAATLPERVDVWGQPADRYHQDTNNPFNVFVNPAIVNQYLPRPEAQMVLELHRATQETRHFPLVVPKTLTIKNEAGKPVTYVLTAEQVTEYQRILGAKTRAAFTKLAGSEQFRDAPEAEQVGFLAKVLAALNEQAKDELRGLAQEEGGGVSGLPAGTTRDRKTPYPLTEKNATGFFQDLEALKRYDALPKQVQRESSAFTQVYDERERLLGEGDQQGVERLERTLGWRTYQRALDLAREKIRRNDQEVEEAGQRQGRWKPLRSGRPERPLPPLPPLRPLSPAGVR